MGEEGRAEGPGALASLRCPPTYDLLLSTPPLSPSDRPTFSYISIYYINLSDLGESMGRSRARGDRVLEAERRLAHVLPRGRR